MYELLKESYRFVKTIDASQELSEEGEKLAYKIECVHEAQILYVAQIGPRASQLVKQAGIFAMRSTHENETINEVLDTLLHLKNTHPPLWMQRLLHAPHSTNC